MSPAFDLFQQDPDGSVPRARVQELAANLPGEYVIANMDTGRKLIVQMEQSKANGQA